MQCFGGLGQRGAVGRTGHVNRRQREKHAALGVDRQVGRGRRRQLAGGRDTTLPVGGVALLTGGVAALDGEKPGDQCTEQKDSGGGEQPAQSAVLARVAPGAFGQRP